MMKNIVLTITASFLMVCLSQAQNNGDELIKNLNTDSISGKVPTYFTPGHKQIALDFQKTITKAIEFYEKRQSGQFNVKLAVLDATQWPKSWVPFGYVFYSNGWIFMNTGLSYEQFKAIYGIESIAEPLDAKLANANVTSSNMMASFYKVYSIHELGHYFMSRLTNAKSPDKWTGEFVATYFAYDFFKHYDGSALEAFKIFHEIDRAYYQPKYSKIADFNTIYMGMGVENYVWYHSNFYFLVEALYHCYGADFISFFEEKFPKSLNENLDTNAIIQILETNCKDTVQNWVKEMEKRTD
ncbi:hypothetical protein ACFO5O_01400 [Geojedonia litorea]|uniref:Uncharacterized protein n=1 Tax=Geojedonia litorea TaxID=1268269 RepID=A0ABV9MY70_9FLAO